MSILYAVLVFGLLIFIHEFGHFIFAKFFGVKVLRFSIGFGPILFSKKLGETEYAISLIPLGGYVKMYGENEEEEIVEDRAKAFLNKPVFQRFLIVFAGPFFNYLLAVLIFIFLYMHGMYELLPKIGEVKEGMPAHEVGLKKGDVILKINGKSIKYWDDLSKFIRENPDKQLLLEIKRGVEVFSVTVKPKLSKVKNIFGEEQKVGLIGIIPSGDSVIVKYGFLESIKLGFNRTNEIVKLTVVGIVKIVKKVIPADNIGGPIMILQMAKKTAESGIATLFAFMAVISINLAILNLLPIPVLDGGHLLFYLIEMIIKRPVSLKVREYAQYVGLAILLALMVFAFYNDISRLVNK